MFYKNQELFTLRERLCSPLFFSGVRCVQSLVLYLVSFVLFVFVLCIVPIVASVYGLSILDCNLYYYKCYDMIYATISSWFPSEFTPLVRWSSPLFLLVTILQRINKDQFYSLWFDSTGIEHSNRYATEAVFVLFIKGVGTGDQEGHMLLT